MISPCKKICALDALSRHCLGCGRTLEEIARWGAMSEAERLAVMARLDERQKALSSPAGAERNAQQ